jgi:hypothetical protein
VRLLAVTNQERKGETTMSKPKRIEVDMKSIMEQMAADRKKRATSAERNKSSLVTAVKLLGITRIEAEFSGGGDSGQIDEVRYFAGKQRISDVDSIKKTIVVEASIRDSTTYCETKKEWVTTTRSPNIEELVEQICYDLLEANHGGWEINEGSYGEFVFNFGKGNKIDLTFNQRVESVETTEETY